MKTVWVIEEGEYSSRCTVGIFSTKENAELFIQAMGPQDKWSTPDLFECILDPHIDQLRDGQVCIVVRMTREGDVVRAAPCQPMEPSTSISRWDNLLSVYVWTTDVTRAIKITNERRAQLIAAGEWEKSRDGQ